MTDDHQCKDANTVQRIRVLRFGKLLLIGIIVGMVLLLGRVMQLKLAPDARLFEVSGTPLSNRLEVNRRGDLLDRRGRIVATSSVGHRLFVDPQQIDDINTIAVDLALLIGGDPIDIDQKICARPGSRYVAIEHLLEDWQVDVIQQANLKGVGLQPRLVRHYPHGDLGARVFGLVGFEHFGLAGLEHVFNTELRPDPGKLTFLRDVRRQPLWIDPDGYQPGKDGDDVFLSIDLVIQELAERRLRKAVEEFNAGGGRIIIADCRSGEILAMSDILNSRPGWDEQIVDPVRDEQPALGRNRCVTDPYEPGSTMKPFVWAVATELGLAKLDENLPIPDGPWRTPYGRVIHEAHYYGQSTWRMVLVKSMNIGMAMIAERMTHGEMQNAIHRFGFGLKTGCGLPGESAGIITSVKEWRRYTQTSVSIGHEIAVTPLQMVRAFCAFARNGSLPTLTMTAFDQQSRDHDQQNQSAMIRAISEQTALATREVMKAVMEEGTGRLSQSEKYQLFGKSGTAQLPFSKGKGYFQDRYISSFIAGAPFRDPAIVVLCVIDDPDRRKGHYGGVVAGPVVRDVIDESLMYLGVPAEKLNKGSL